MKPQQQTLNNLVRDICRSQPFKLAYNLNSTMYEVQDLQILLKGSCWKHPYNELPYGEQHWVMCTVRNRMRPSAPTVASMMDKPTMFSRMVTKLTKDQKDREFALMYGGGRRSAQLRIGESMVESFSGDFAKLEELAKGCMIGMKPTISSGTSTGRSKNPNPCMEIPLPRSGPCFLGFRTDKHDDYPNALSAAFEKEMLNALTRNPTPKKETAMNVKTIDYVNNRNVADMTEGELIDAANTCAEEVKIRKEQIENLSETIKGLKSANEKSVADRKLIQGHIADKRSK